VCLCRGRACVCCRATWLSAISTAGTGRTHRRSPTLGLCKCRSYILCNILLEEPQPLKHLCAVCRRARGRSLGEAVPRAMVQPPEPGRNQGGVVGGGGRCDSPQGPRAGHAPRHAHTGVASHHSLLSRSASLLSRAQGIRARLPLTYSYPTPSREESAVAVQAQPPVLAVLLLAVLHRECGATDKLCVP